MVYRWVHCRERLSQVMKVFRKHRCGDRFLLKLRNELHCVQKQHEYDNGNCTRCQRQENVREKLQMRVQTEMRDD